MKKNKKIFVTKDVLWGSLVGGPWASTYFFYKNLIGIEQNKYAKRALYIGIPSPIFFILLGFMVPSILITFAVYAALVVFLTMRYQKAIVRAYGTQKPEAYYSNTKASMVTIYFAVAYLFVIFSANFIVLKNKDASYTSAEILAATVGISSFDTVEYNDYLKEITEKDTTALALINELFTNQTMTLDQSNSQVSKIKELYAANTATIDKLEAIKDTPKTLQEQNKFIRTYTELRLEQVVLLEKSVNEDTGAYISELTKIGSKIDSFVYSNKKAK